MRICRKIVPPLVAGVLIFLGVSNPLFAQWGGQGIVKGTAEAENTMPEFPRQTADAWLNSAPIKAAELRGKVLLLEVYTTR